MISFPNPIRISANGNVLDFDEEARRGEAIIYVVGFVLLAVEVEGGAGFQMVRSV